LLRDNDSPVGDAPAPREPVMDQNRFEKPRWSRDLERFLPLKSQFVLSGNVRDLQVVEFEPGVVAPVGLNQALTTLLGARGQPARPGTPPVSARAGAVATQPSAALG
jgi:hypothetical protein